MLILAMAGVAAMQSGAPDSYPIEAMRLHQQGRVRMHLVVAKDGHISGCSVIGSSGSRSLDADACVKAARVHFTPARDSEGRSVESTTDLSMSYVLPR